MSRPKSDDPKLPMPLRVPASVLARWEALGPDWRSKAEAVLAAHVAPRAEPVPVRAAPAVHVDVPVIARPRFNPQPKPGKR